MTAPASTWITACVIACNEAPHLIEVLPGLRWADEMLVVVDETSTDGSAALAQSLGARVELRPFSSFAQFRNAALDLAECPWLLFVDADERVPPPLAAEVTRAVQLAEERLADADAPVGFWLPRKNIILGHPVRGGGWSPDHQLRLLRRDRARYDASRPVHEVALLDGPAGYLSEALVHYNYQSVRQLFAKQRRYTRMEAAAALASGERPRRRSLLGAPLHEFKRRYLDLGGWVDGPVGLFLSATMAYYAFERVRLTRRGAAARAAPSVHAV